MNFCNCVYFLVGSEGLVFHLLCDSYSHTHTMPMSELKNVMVNFHMEAFLSFALSHLIPVIDGKLTGHLIPSLSF